MFDAGYGIRGRPATIVTTGEPVLDARGVLRHLRRGLGLMLLCGLLAIAAGRAALTLVAPSYTSVVQILLDPAGLNIVDRDIADRRPQWDSGITQVESQVRIVRSDPVLRRVVRRLELDRDPEFVRPASQDPVVAWLAQALTEPPTPDAPVETALDALRRKVFVRRVERTVVVDVFVETRDARKSARIADAIAASFLDEDARSRSGTALRMSDAMSRGLVDLRRDVEAVDARAARYRAENNLIGADGTPLNEQQLGDLNRQLVTASIRTAEARARLEQARRVRPDDAGTALPEMLQSREMRSLRQQVATLSRGTAELVARLGARHPALAEQAAQLRDLQGQIQREKERIVETAQKDYERAAASEAAIRAGFEGAKTQQVGAGRAEIGLRELTRELDARREVYEASLRRARELGEQSAVDSARIRILSPASIPPTRSWPPPAKLVLPQALALGLLIGAAISLLRGTRRDRRLFQEGRLPVFPPDPEPAGA